MMQLLYQLDRQVMLKQSLFGFPWLLVTMMLAIWQEPNVSFSFVTMFFIVGAFIGARTAGMCLNRLIDRHIDAENPRTMGRPLPKGEMSVQVTAALGALFSALFFLCLLQLPTVCIWVGSLAALSISLYSHMKRVSVLCHFVLGLIHGLMPVCVWAALTGIVSAVPVMLGAALLLSIAASDIVYACQDIAFDRAKNLKSIPALLGKERAVWFAKCLHAGAFLFLLVLACMTNIVLVAPAAAVGVVYLLAYAKKSDAEVFQFANSFSGIVYLLVFGVLWQGL